MLTAADFFAKFKGKGMLFPAVWTPAGGGTGAGFEARLMKGPGDSLTMIAANQLSVQFITADAPGANQGDVLTLTINDVSKAYHMRELDQEHCSADGTLTAYLVRETA